MRQHAASGRTPPHTAADTHSAAPRQAPVALAPPAYGIALVDAPAPSAGPRATATGLPPGLRSGVEALSGLSLDDVRVHYNSPQPAHVDALAYAQGSDIHLAPGQERHLPHEAWHVVQQAQRRVMPTMQLKTGTPVNDDNALEREADLMGTQAMRAASTLPAHGSSARSLPGPAAPSATRSHTRAGGGGVIQRVGGKKIGFVLTPPLPDGTVTVQTGQKLLLDTWDAVRKAGHDLKVGTVKTDVEAAAAEMIAIRKNKADRDAHLTARKLNPLLPDVDVQVPLIPPTDKTKHGFSQYYAHQLTSQGRTNQEKLLLATAPFKSGVLKISGRNIEYRADKKDAFVKVAELKTENDAFETRAVAAAARPVYSKRGIVGSYNSGDPAEAKDYVKDSRGVVTRRFVYVEKNYWQMMEFFVSHHMEGRFQAYMRAAGETTPDLYEHRDEGVDLVIPGPNRAAPNLNMTVEQMAVAHQKLGSGPQQRGVSLTATPKVNATYVNTGENFRTNRGFRLKVDLAKIPDPHGPLLINHYSQGGVIDAPTTSFDTRRERGKPGKYPYKESSIHARELLLEHLKPEWVVAIEYHDQDNKTGSGAGSQTLDQRTPLGGRNSLFELAKHTFGGQKYEEGFIYGLRRAENTRALNPHFTTDQDYVEGFTGARLFVKGWNEGKQEFNRLGPGDDARAAAHANLTLPQYIYDQSMNKKEHEDKFDLFRLGYLRGRSGKSLITSPRQLATLSTSD
jgi:hypothetical protein